MASFLAAFRKALVVPNTVSEVSFPKFGLGAELLPLQFSHTMSFPGGKRVEGEAWLCPACAIAQLILMARPKKFGQAKQRSGR